MCIRVLLVCRKTIADRAGLSWNTRNPVPKSSIRLSSRLYEFPAEDLADNVTLEAVRAKLLAARKNLPTACSFEHFYGDHSLINDSWLSPDIRRIYFLSTIYADSQGDACVRCLSFEREQLRQKFVLLKSVIDAKDRIVIIKND